MIEDWGDTVLRIKLLRNEKLKGFIVDSVLPTIKPFLSQFFSERA